MSSAWSQLEQLLTCAICLDRFRNPKLLPCQHTFCMEPCMEGLVDYVRKQIKCPECRAEHRIPYQGIQTFPTNVTLIRFLDLHRNITGEEPEPVPSMMERCGVCGEKAIIEKCAHCEKKACEECKEAHLDIMRREIARINIQVKRALNRLQEALGQSEKNSDKLTQNQVTIREEIEEIVRRFVKDLKDKEEKLLHELDIYADTEVKMLSKLKEDLDIEVSNIASNCDLIEKHVLDASEGWTDVELVEYKDIFHKTLDFLRNFDCDSSDYTRRIRFLPNNDLDVLRRNLINFGELKLPISDMETSPVSSSPGLINSSTQLTIPQQNSLMRSQSDHRLAAQFARRDSGRFLEVNAQNRLSGGGGYSDSERDQRATSPVSYGLRGRREAETSRYSQRESNERDTRNRYLRTDLYSTRGRSGDEEESGSHFRSRFMRDRQSEMEHDSDYSSASHRSVRFEEPAVPSLPAVKVFDTNEVSRGPLSGVIKLADSAHLMERLHQNQVKAKIEKDKKEEEANNPPPPPPSYQTPVPRRPPARQLSEDEIDKQKKLNQAAAAATSTAVAATPVAVPLPVSPVPIVTPKTSSTVPESPTSRYLPRRVTTLREEEEKSASSRRGSDASSHSSNSQRRSSDTSTLDDVNNDDLVDSDSNVSRIARRRKSITSNDENTNTTSRDTRPQATTTRPIRSSFGKNVPVTEDIDTYSSKRRTSGADTQSTPKEERQQSSFFSRLASKNNSTINSTGTPPSRFGTSTAISRTVTQIKDDEDEDDGENNESESESDEEEDDSEESEDTEEEDEIEKSKKSDDNSKISSSSSAFASKAGRDTELPSAVAALLNRSAQVRRDSSDSRSTTPTTGSRNTRFSRSNTVDDPRSDKSSSVYQKSPLNKKPSEQITSNKGDDKAYRTRIGLLDDDDGHNSYLSSGPTAHSRFLSRSKTSSAIASTNRTNNFDDSQPEDTRYSSYSRRESLRSFKDPQTVPGGSTGSASSAYQSSFARSRSSHKIGERDESGDGEDSNPTSPTFKGKYSSGTSSPSTAARRGSGYQYKTRDVNRDITRDSSKESEPSEPTSTSSAWSQYLRNKYGSSRTNSLGSSGNTKASLLKSKSSHAVYSRNASDDSSDDDSSNRGSAALRRRGSRDVDGPLNTSSLTGYGVSFPRSMYLQKKRMSLKIGVRGTEPCCFTWPRGVAVGPDNSIVVADSSNHRVQVFDSTGRFSFEFGSYGSNEGEFDCLAGVSVNRIGQFIVSDRYNHRIQVFDPSGRFLRAFGCEGRADGRFSYPWGITTDSLGFIYVCDKENHRIQVFQSDGTFVGKFGAIGSRPGFMEHPHYIAVSNTNRVIVSDSNNHRIQIFDVNGRSLSTFGSEGSEDGQFKFPRGVAVDDQGYIIVGDSGNNRVQIFNPDGSFLKGFGGWGSSEGEFKGLEGVAVSSTGNILVCDRENHRIQVF